MTSLGSVTSLGVGSGFDLQQMLEDFRAVDEEPLESMRSEITVIEERLDKFDEVKSKLIDMKSHALTLSLQSSYIERNIEISDEEVITATGEIALDECSPFTDAIASEWYRRKMVPVVLGRALQSVRE